MCWAVTSGYLCLEQCIIIGRDGTKISGKPCTNSRMGDRRGWHFKALGCGIIFVHYTFWGLQNEEACKIVSTLL